MNMAELTPTNPQNNYFTLVFKNGLTYSIKTPATLFDLQIKLTHKSITHELIDNLITTEAIINWADVSIIITEKAYQPK